MFSKILTTKSIKNYSKQIKELKNEIETADAIVIGAGAGMSTSAGMYYNGERFERYFQIFIRNMGSGIFIREAFILMKHSKNIGRGGHGIFL